MRSYKFDIVLRVMASAPTKAQARELARVDARTLRHTVRPELMNTWTRATKAVVREARS